MRALVVLCVLVGRVASAAPVETIVREALAADLPSDLGISEVHLPRSLATADLDPARVAIIVPHALKAGRPSIKVAIIGRAPVWVPVTLAPLVRVAIAEHALAQGVMVTASDVRFELRTSAGAPADTILGSRTTHAVAAGAVLGATDLAQSPPIARGTEVMAVIRRGALRIRTRAKLEASARPGQETTARLGATAHVVHGTLADSSTFIVGDVP